ncbi:RNA polymerase sigma factor [Alicyclobacillus cycloheptanicus]|uniref:RNA polymerase sigma-70 factor (ECF subfamily) n=1 Tax=Alicyclobacillus cycloheptanicus TaxID=1457 RepID=A0ABT9XIQ2_9BACL|nr:RNA polymerase sigma factor [Alicyclobacillus cycloheptanicus]MDQ0190082.1 RNA polymerase sigma-70 factor (ECF subfamily) [Alicyclobacillus cycloheptanicus]WDM02059.1 RNA polymerase sigma factor [Alicyclobacillus cycloheptanicus]
MASLNESIEQLFELYADEIYRYARYAAPKSADAKDVVQEVFLRAIRSWDSFRQDANPRTWLFQIARNYIYDLLRKKRVEQTYLERHKPDLSKVSVSLETLVELEEAVAQLSHDKRQVFTLRGIQAMSVRETAEILGWTEAKVKTTLHRAIQDLRRSLDEPTGTKEGETDEFPGGDRSGLFRAERSKTERG